MDQKTFMAKMQDLLEREDELTLDMSLDDIDEWDSLSFVAFLAMVSPLGKYSFICQAEIGDVFSIHIFRVSVPPALRSTSPKVIVCAATHSAIAMKAPTKYSFNLFIS